MKKNSSMLAVIGFKIVNIIKEDWSTYIVLENGIKIHAIDLEHDVKKFNRQQKKKGSTTPKQMNLYNYISLILGRKITWYSDKRSDNHRLKPQTHITAVEFDILSTALGNLKLKDGITISLKYENLSAHNQNYRYLHRPEKGKKKAFPGRNDTYREVIIRTNHYPSQIIIEQ